MSNGGVMNADTDTQDDLDRLDSLPAGELAEATASDFLARLVSTPLLSTEQQNTLGWLVKLGRAAAEAPERSLLAALALPTDGMDELDCLLPTAQLQAAGAQLLDETIAMTLRLPSAGTFEKQLRAAMHRRRTQRPWQFQAEAALKLHPVGLLRTALGLDMLARGDERARISTLLQAAERYLEDAAATLRSRAAADEQTLRQVARLSEQLQTAATAAADHMVRANMRLVVSIAKHYVTNVLEFEDIVQEGSLGLMRAVQLFEPQKGFRFSTYATWWIKQSCQRTAVPTGFRLPMEVARERRTIARATEALTVDGQLPSLQQLAQATGLDPSRISELIRLNSNILSLDSTQVAQDSGPGRVLADTIPDPGAASSLNLTLQMPELRAKVRGILESLTGPEREVLELRFGIRDGIQRTLDQVGLVMNISRERVRQIESSALKHMRHPARAVKLKDYIE